MTNSSIEFSVAARTCAMPAPARRPGRGFNIVGYCAGALLLLAAMFMIVNYGFNAVVKCELERYRFWHDGQNAVGISISTAGFLL
jgi:hypothetical protein